MTANECGPKLVPVDEAARKLGTTALNILMQIKRGRLAGEEIDGAWYVTAASMARPAVEEREPSVSPACPGGHCRGCLSGR